MTNTAFAVLMALSMLPVSFLSVKVYMLLFQLARNRKY